MLDLLKFIFQDFGHWFGTFILLVLFLSVPVEIIGAIGKVYRRGKSHHDKDSLQ